MKRLLIIGAGNFGREVLDWARQIPPATRDWEVAGFLDGRTHVLDGYACPVGIVGDPSTYVVGDDDRFICAIGEPGPKLEYVETIKNKGGTFITLIHPTAIVGSGSTIGEGCILCPYAVVTTNVHLGRFVTLNLAATVGHDAVIGDGTTLAPHADATGRTVLGRGVFMGSHAVVLPRGRVGDFAVVGAGSVVVKHAGPGTTVCGVPAREI